MYYCFLCVWQRDINRRDQRIDQLQHELQLQISEKENATRSLRQQVKDLNDRFRVVDETGVRGMVWQVVEGSWLCIVGIALVEPWVVKIPSKWSLVFM